LGGMARRTDKAPGPTIVLFVRHGTTPTTGRVLPGQAKGLHLSESGKAEAAAVAERIAALPAGSVEAVYASTLERAGETAAEIASRVGKQVEVEPDLVDCDTGEWTGQELATLRKLPEWQTVERWPSGWRFPGGESSAELQARIAGVVERLRARHPGKMVVAVSHADPIKAAVGSALGSPFDFNDRIAIAPCSVTAIAYGRAGATVLAVNSTGDLARAVPTAPQKGRGHKGDAAAAASPSSSGVGQP
jgi:probable phosphomutase (TIGR03848 family)